MTKDLMAFVAGLTPEEIVYLLYSRHTTSVLSSQKSSKRA